MELLPMSIKRTSLTTETMKLIRTFQLIEQFKVYAVFWLRSASIKRKVVFKNAVEVGMATKQLGDPERVSQILESDAFLKIFEMSLFGKLNNEFNTSWPSGGRVAISST